MNEITLDEFIYNRRLIIDILTIKEDNNYFINKLINFYKKLNKSFYKDLNYYNELGRMINNLSNENIHKVKDTLHYFYWDMLFDVYIQIEYYGNDRFGIFSKENIKIPINKLGNKVYKRVFRIIFVDDINTNNYDNYDKCYTYDDFFENIFYISRNIYLYDYNYHFLNNELKSCRLNNKEILIVGNSYPLNGLDKSMFGMNCVNLSSTSQDLYYSYKMALKAIEYNSCFKKCIIGVGYYVMNFDISSSTNNDNIDLIKNIYYPILNDKHNFKYECESSNLKLDDYVDDIVIKELFNLDKLLEHFSILNYNINNNFWNEYYPRCYMSFDKMTEEEKIYQGKTRYISHNKLINYKRTRIEYNKIMDDFILLLNSKNIDVIIVVFPKTSYYLRGLNCIEQFYCDISNIKGEYTLIDMNKVNIFTDSDYRDVDHLNKQGYKKCTKYILEKCIT